MLLPYADDHPRENKFPWMNWVLIAINVAIFMQLNNLPNYEDIVMQYGFIPADFTVTTLFTALFLHGSLMHLLGNMWFLYLFGDNVENRLGPFKYLCAYLLCGVAGDYCHYLFFPDSTIPTIGASGAIFGVMGMYLCLFPRNRVRIFYFFLILIGRISVPAFWAIGMFAGMELLYSRMMTQGHLQSDVGHLAHAGGFVAGAALAMLMAGLQLIPTLGGELWSILFDFNESGGSPRDGRRDQQLDQPINARYRILDEEPAPEHSAASIARLLHAGRLNEARRAWLQLVLEDRNAVLAVTDQLELAIFLDRNGDREAARDAYERLITHYPNHQPFAAEANLALAGLLLREFRETGNRQKAPLIQSLLQRVVQSHPQPARRALAMSWLQSLSHA